MPAVAFVPNDPLASGSPPVRQIPPGRFPSGAATYRVQPTAPPGTYAPHTPGFDHFQTQAALIVGLRNWKAIDGRLLTSWFGNQASLPVFTDNGDDLNAFYDRKSLQFFSHTFGGTTVHSCESVDIVCHEQGHGLLDAIRSDFFDVPFIEVGSLHEAFGDSMAILVALSDPAIRHALLATSPDLSGTHFVESLAEELGDAIRREYGPASVEAGALRHALNSFRWTDPTALPTRAPADQLCGEVHSFSRVFTGAFYDVIRNIYAASPHTSAGLKKAANTAGRLLIAAIRTVPAATRIYAGVGQRMLQADVTLGAGANAAAIRSAFEAHGMPLAAPVASLPVPLAAASAVGRRGLLREQMGVAPDATLRVTPVDSAMHRGLAHVTSYRPLTLSGEGLDGVQVMVPAAARVVRRGAAIVDLIGEVAPADDAADENARAFARALVAHGQIRTAPAAGRRVAPTVAAAPDGPPRMATHEIRLVSGQPTLVRVGFACLEG
jgi:hypothetical protein